MPKHLTNNRYSKHRTNYLAAVIMLALLLVATGRTIFAQSPGVVELPNTRITVNGSLLALDPQNPAIESNNRILVPMRVILESLGADIGWVEATQTVTASGSNYEIVLCIGIMWPQ